MAWHEGDIATFKVRKSLKHEDKLDAYELVFLENQDLDKLREEIETNEVLKGYLRLTPENTFTVQHKSTRLVIPVQISEWETNRETVYFKRVNSTVDFNVVKTSHNLNKMVAVLADRVFSTLYYRLKELKDNKGDVEAFITKKTPFGNYATIFDGQVNARMHVSSSRETSTPIPTVGEVVLAKIGSVGTKRIVHLKLT